MSPKRATAGATAIFISPRNKARRWWVRDVGEPQCVSDVPDATGSDRFEIHGCTGMFCWGVPRCFQWVDRRVRLSPTAIGFQQPGVPIALKPCTARSLECGNDDLACDENSPNFRRAFETYPTEILGFMWFLNLKARLDATLTLLTATGAIAVDLWDQSRLGVRNLQAATPSWKRVLPTESSKDPAYPSFHAVAGINVRVASM